MFIYLYTCTILFVAHPRQTVDRMSGKVGYAGDFMKRISVDLSRGLC